MDICNLEFRLKSLNFINHEFYKSLVAMTTERLNLLKRN